ncbi:MAG: ATP-binding cassette domain-containing protein, partial [Candidatus Coatesbacteria bacterium]|nr:ATP-binding cassette domain-containing protein [Candidatus Coatesbacteria bacterium]
MFFWPIEALTWLYNSALSAMAASERIFQLLDAEPEVKDREDAIEMPEIRGDVEFRDVFFSYDVDGKREWVLKDISLKAKAGQMIALVGPTGGGKSSTVSLIPRFYEAQKGKVLIDGYDVRDVTLESLHRQMGIVLQESFLFTGTVMENLKFANPDISEAEIIEGAKALGAHESIIKLANGYQTEVKERGEGLSQGERQLICFTRAFVADPRILILDEATSSVDTMIEIRLQNAMNRLMQNRTSFVVAHRLSTVRHADLVLVISDGLIKERGTHGELLAMGGEYARLYHEYMRDLG